MNTLAWILLGISVGWVIAGAVVAVLLGRTTKARDLQVPRPEGEAVPSVAASEKVQRHALLGDVIGDLLDEAHVSVTVRYHGDADAPTFGLAQLAKVLDEAGLINDTAIGEQA